MRLAIRKAGSTRLLQLLAVTSSPPDNPRKPYRISAALGEGLHRQLCRRALCARWLCPDVGGHFRAVVAHSQPGAGRAGERTCGIGVYPSKRFASGPTERCFSQAFRKTLLRSAAHCVCYFPATYWENRYFGPTESPTATVSKGKAC